MQQDLIILGLRPKLTPYIPPKTDIAGENRFSQEESSLPTTNFQGIYVGFREGHIMTRWFSNSVVFRVPNFQTREGIIHDHIGHAAAERSGIGKWPMNCCGCFPCAESGGPAAGGKSPQHFQTRHPWWGRWQQLLSQQRSGAPKKQPQKKGSNLFQGFKAKRTDFSWGYRLQGLIFVEAIASLHPLAWPKGLTLAGHPIGSRSDRSRWLGK